MKPPPGLRRRLRIRGRGAEAPHAPYRATNLAIRTVATRQYVMLDYHSSATVRNWPHHTDSSEMLDHRMNSPTDRVAALVNRMLTERSLRFPVSPDDDLRSVGLSSLDMVNLVLSVESEFDVSVPDADITPAKFRSISTIAALVAALLPEYEVS